MPSAVEPLPRTVGERAIALDTDDFARDARKHGGLVARAGADLEHAMDRAQPQLLGHVGDDIGLADGLAAGDRQRLIGISSGPQFRFDEVLARDFVHRAQAPPRR